MPRKPAAKKQPAKKAPAKKKLAPAAPTEELANPDQCNHPRSNMLQFGWGTVCGDCGKRYR